MKSLFSLLYLALQQRIAAIGDGKKTIRYIDHDLGQLLAEHPSISYPAVLIDMNEFNFKTLGENVQTGEGIIKLRLVLAPYSATNNLTPVEYREKGLRFYELEDAIHKTLQQWLPSYIVDNEETIVPNYFGKLNRISTRTDSRRPDLRVRELSYRIAFEDYHTKSPTQTAPATFGFEGELHIDPHELLA